jgi:Zn-dependent protease
MFEVTKREIRDLTIAFFVLTFCFAISTVGFNLHAFISILPIVMIGCAVGSIVHELGHKFTAMKYDCRAEFELWPLGLLIAVASSFFGVVFATPGVAHIYPEDIDDETNGKISISGPMANIALAIMALAAAALIYPLIQYSEIFYLMYLICTIGFSVNSFLAAFNLFPIYSLDGINVLKWNVKIWIITIAVAGSMVLMSITIGAENMVLLLLGA